MTERETEDARRVAQRYRELGAEEPPRTLDDAIRAAARREAGARPAPLVSPGARRRWYLPLAAAAVIVLSVAVTMQMQREQPDLDAPAPLAKRDLDAPAPLAKQTAPAAPPAAATEPAPAPKPAPQLSQEPAETQAPRTVAEAARRGIVPPAAKEEARAEKPFTSDPPASDRREIAAAAPAVAPASVGKPAALPMPAERQVARDAAEMTAKPAGNVGAVAGAAAPAARSDTAEAMQSRVLTPRMRAVEAKDKGIAEPETPEKWLERIAVLRGEGKHEEADKALVEFRQRYPEYRIPEAMLQKVQRPR